MSQEKVREILSHVDMSKIDLSSFKLSESKFDELSHLYRNRVVLSSFSIMMHKEEYAEEEVTVAFEMLANVVKNPNLYSYVYVYTAEREAVDKVINDYTTDRDRKINDVKLKAIDKRIKDAYKSMRKIIELALEHSNTFEDEFDEEIVERCMQIAKSAIENGRRKAAEGHVEATPSTNQQTEQVDTASHVKEAETVVLSEVGEQHEETPKAKASFWKRMLGRV